MMTPTHAAASSPSNRSLAIAVSSVLGASGLWSAFGFLRSIPVFIQSLRDEILWAPPSVTVFSLARFGAFLAMWVWLHRETARAWSERRHGVGSPGAAVAVWFIPIAGMFMGPARLDALRTAYAYGQRRSPRVALAGFAMLANALGSLAFAAMTAQSSITFKPLLIIAARVLDLGGVTVASLTLAALVMGAQRAIDDAAPPQG